MKPLFKLFSIALILLIAQANFAQKVKNVTTQNSAAIEIARWEKHVAQTNIIRDEWGIPHIYGKTDADAVFGLMYAQCEENFPQIEKNYLEMLGRTSELTYGGPAQQAPGDVYADLMMKLIQDSAAAINDYNNSPAWFKKLLIAHADGINYYLYKHPEVHPKVIFTYKPWYHLMWTDGSVSPTRYGGIKRKDVFDFYKTQDSTFIHKNIKTATSSINNRQITQQEAWANIDDYAVEEKTLKGSNGFAIAPKHSKNGNAMLYINPHVPFYFRSEMHMVSEEGLNVYGAVTWGQMFIYQGFNEHAGWMHTSSYADVADVYQETVKQENGNWFYLYENKWLPVVERKITMNLPEKQFVTYKTHHGPIMGSHDGKWLSLSENNRSLNALMECWSRTKANNLKEYKAALNLLANNSNNTVYADADGNIAYWHGNFMPKRDNQFDFTKPVDGSTKATEWKGIHALNEIVQSINPENGWLQNCNATPYTVAGKNSPKEKDYPKYMAPDGENARGLNAVRLLEKVDKIDLDELIQLGYNKHLAAFDILLPSFMEYTKTVTLTTEQSKAVNYLASWNHDADTNSIAQTIAIEWATKLMSAIPAAETEEAATQSIFRFNKIVNEVSNEKKLAFLDTALMHLKIYYSNLPMTQASWEIPWGQINRYQRAFPNTEFPFSESRPSIAVAQTSSKFGQLPAFESKPMASSNKKTTLKRYGYSGSSFIAAVSFGKKLEAKTIITGGQSFDPNNPHFTDQAQDYINGNFKTIHFYKEDVLAHKVISYKPGLER